ncbi:MAG: ATP-dependent protease LonB [Candidatus Hodarchaeota archaeon]
MTLQHDTLETEQEKKDQDSRIDNIDDIMPFETTEEISIPFHLVDQVIGQDEAVEIIRKAAIQRRNVLLIGDPGTGKSMLGQALAELLPREELEDILCLPNPNDNQNPRIMVVPSLEGRKIVEHYKEEARRADQFQNMIAIAVPLGIFLLSLAYFLVTAGAGIEVLLMGMFVSIFAFMFFGQSRSRKVNLVPKLLVDTTDQTSAPFGDATGAHAGALLGDVRHDPFQSGGLGTPAHTRVEAGLIHKSHKGVLYIDEVATLAQKTQQQLLTAMQEKKLSITGRSELSSGAMVMTEAVPSDFVLVASGNVETVRRMHPALRSRIRGYGYEVFMKNTMPDSKDNLQKLVRFIAQEISKDGKIPHFKKEAVIEILREARKRASRKKRLTLRLRDLGGLIRAAGDLAREEGTAYVLAKHVIHAKSFARSLENQIADRYIEDRKDYDVILNKGAFVGRVNGLYVTTDPTGGARAGGVTPIAAKVTPGAGKIVATGKLRVIARESVQNVSALIKAYTGIDISSRDVHIQFLGTYGIEGDSASITIATAIVSDLEELAVKQDIAMTGSLSIRGEVLPVGGVSAKIEGAYAVGIKDVIIPHSNLQDVVLEKSIKEQVRVHPVKTLTEVLDLALMGWTERGKKIGAQN